MKGKQILNAANQIQAQYLKLQNNITVTAKLGHKCNQSPEQYIIALKIEMATTMQ